jgi:hypothetical protein
MPKKHALLLLHGTVYGTLRDSPPVKDYEGITASIGNSYATPWRQDLLAGFLPPDTRLGPMIDNSPIDVISWSAIGDQGESGMEIWNKCLTLFMRHI